MNVVIALDILVPEAIYGGSVTANTEQQYNKLRWEDDRPQPAWAELVAAWENYTPPEPPPSLEERLQAAEEALLFLLEGDD